MHTHATRCFSCFFHSSGRSECAPQTCFFWTKSLRRPGVAIEQSGPCWIASSSAVQLRWMAFMLESCRAAATIAATNDQFRNLQPRPRPAMLDKSLLQGVHPWNDLKSSLLEANRPRKLEMAKKCSYLLALTTIKNHKIDTLQVFLLVDAID